jgi:hypothetical protein
MPLTLFPDLIRVLRASPAYRRFALAFVVGLLVVCSSHLVRI